MQSIVAIIADKSLAAILWVGSPEAKAAVCKTATLDTPKVRVLPGPP